MSMQGPTCILKTSIWSNGYTLTKLPFYGFLYVMVDAFDHFSVSEEPVGHRIRKRID
jgi:hypothetical protein